MVFTIPTAEEILNATYTVRLLLQDNWSEKVRKVSRLKNAGNAGNLEEAYQVFEALTNAGLMVATGSMSLTITGASQSITESGQHFASVKNMMILGFSKTHPLNAAKVVKASFAIPAPIDAIIDQDTNIGKPLYERGIDFATAATPLEALGALIDWLEDALIYRAVDGVDYAGSWTYSDALSGLVTVAGIIDGSTLT